MHGGGCGMTVEPGRRITVMHFASEPVRGGAEEHMLTLLRRLDRSHFQPIVAAHPHLVEMLRPDLPPDVEAIPLTLRGPRDVKGALSFVREVRARKVGVVHSHMFQAGRLASPLAWLAGVPVIVETPHVREHWRRGLIKGSFMIDRLVGRFVTAYIAVSRANAEYLVGEKRLPRAKVHLVRNGIAVERFDPDRSASVELRRSVGLEDDVPVAVVLARLEPQKGHLVLLEAWQSVTRKFPRARLVCVGDGRLREELRARSGALGIGSSVRFVGYQSNVSDWLALADFTVLPSFYEGLPLAAIESLAAGRPVVATRIDGTSEVVIDGRTGLLAPPGRSDLLASAIGRLIESPELARVLGSAGRRLVENQFNETRQVAETEAVYFDALRGAGSASGRTVNPRVPTEEQAA
jgi:glycosyltransferase involved in cell wall biosynthesis